MIGADTNVLLRAVVQDDSAQCRSALEFFGQRSAADPAYVGLAVIVEFVWSLRRSYGYSDADANEAVRRLCAASDIVLEKRDLVEECLALARNGVGLADLLIAAANLAEGCTRTVTFDQDAAKRVTGMELLA